MQVNRQQWRDEVMCWARVVGNKIIADEATKINPKNYSKFLDKIFLSSYRSQPRSFKLKIIFSQDNSHSHHSVKLSIVTLSENVSKRSN